ncbi:MAG: hypothetical protein J7K66_02890 [Anaerolineaceae bacterium]|nr:hypothetical protein [Anaerolineaceae bacterium]
MRRSVIVLCSTLLLMSASCTKMPLLEGIFNASNEENPSEAVFRDDFSDTKSGWKKITMDEGSAGYAKDTYQITVNVPDADIFTTYARIFGDSAIIVKAVRIGGSDNNNFGVICRFQDHDNFYAGQISSDGFAGIFKVENGEYQLLGHKNMVPVPSIMGGGGENEIRFECIEKTLTLTVNNSLADSQQDDAFSSGEFGLIAGTIDGNSGIFQFDDLEVFAR